MLVPFDQLSDTSKIWIYQAEKELNKEQIALVKTKLEKFLNTWQSHGKDLVASYKIPYNQFIIIGVDEDKTNSSGCSVDASVALLKELEQDLQVNLFNRMKVAFKIQDTVNTVSLPDFQRYIKEGKVNPNTIVFNNLVKNKSELNQNWETPAKNSWHKRLFE